MKKDKDTIDSDVSYTLRIASNLRDRIVNHVMRLKQTKQENQSRNSWFISAIQEKLESDRSNPDYLLKLPKPINIPIPRPTYRQLEEQVALLKALQGNASKQQWIEEAVLEKLDREEEPTKREFRSRFEATPLLSKK